MRKSPKSYDISIDNISPPQSNEDIEKSYIDNEDKLILQKSLKNLNYDYSRVLYLFYFKEMTQKEICEEMEKNPKQIKNLLFRAKAALKKELESYKALDSHYDEIEEDAKRIAEENKGKNNIETMKTTMSTPIENGGPYHDVTRYQMVVEPGDMTIHLKLSCNRNWVELPMSQYLRARQ